MVIILQLIPCLLLLSQNTKQSCLIHTARLVNDSKPIWVVDQVKTMLTNCLIETGKRENEIKIACFGLAFKPDIDDLRESPAMEITEMITNWNTDTIFVIEPNINELPKSLDGLCQLVPTEVGIPNADIILLLVDHKKFKAINGKEIQQKWVIDTKVVWR